MVSTQRQCPGPLSAAVAGLCRSLLPQVCAETAAGFRTVVDRLSAPLQVAVAGRIKSGKSTLVNALIGRRVAPTGVGECTRLVTRFQYGTVDVVEIVFTDGEKRVLPFDAHGRIPADLGADTERISHVEAYLTNAVLRDLTVIDTPGLGSLDSDSAARGADVLGELDPVSRSAVAGAEAVVYVVTQAVRADDQRVLDTFAAATGNWETGPVNAIAVLNKADMVEPGLGGGDPWANAQRLARKQASVLRPRVAEVLPVMGLLAETAETGAFTQHDAAVLGALANLDQTTRDTLLLSADLFTSWECEVPASDRGRLLELMDLYGVARAVEVIGSTPDISAGALRRMLLEASGFAAVAGKLDSVFRARADGIKAAAGLASITALAQSADATRRQLVHDAIERLLAKPEAHQLRLLEALTLVTSGAVPMPDDLADEVFRVGSTNDVGEQLGLPGRDRKEWCDFALERAGWWRSFASFGATPAQSRVAHVVHRAYFLIWQHLKTAG